MKIIVSFLTTNFSGLKEFWNKNNSKRKESRFKGTDKIFDVNLGGKMVIMDWDKKKIIKQRNIKTPAGFDMEKDKIYVCTSGNKISILDLNLKTKYSISNQYLNDLHSLNLIKNKIIVASTGLDCILILDKKGNLNWSWFATENGYDKDSKGRLRLIDRNTNHRNIQYPTLQQTTHLNSAIYIGKTKYFNDTIYCSLFHQGKIIAIDKNSLNHKVILKDLKHPHSIYFVKNKIIISDTENKSALITDKNLRNIKRIKIKDIGWVQDANFLRNGNIIISDPDNNRIVEFNLRTKKIDNEMFFNKEWRIYQAKELG